jgi:hypothetical protein
MSTISLHLPRSLHETARALAEKENVSLDQLITLALAEKVSALMTEDYLLERARRGDPQRFREALAKVPDIEPEAHDRL